MSSLQIPDDIQILLDCLTSREDLELDEMSPLQDWIESTPGAELAVSKTLAQNTELETALSEMKISVPKTLQRKVSSYVRQNTDVAASDTPKPIRAREREAKPAGPVVKGAKYLAGATMAIAVMVLLGASIVYVWSFYVHLDTDQVAMESIEWIERIDNERSWKLPRGAYSPPNYFDKNVAVTNISEIDTKYGKTEAFELWHNTRNIRGVLFVFQSNNKYTHKFIGKRSDYSNNRYHAGIAKDGRTSYVLAVQSPLESDYRSFIGHDYRAPELAFLLRTAWLLC